MRESDTYTTTKNGEQVTVGFTGDDALRDVADLEAALDADYNGSTSPEYEQVKRMLGDLQAGKPLSGAQWAQLKAIKERHPDLLEEFRASREGRQQGLIESPDVGVGRILESALLIPPSAAVQPGSAAQVRADALLRIARVREGSPKPPPGLRPAAPHSEAAEVNATTPGKECGTCQMFDCGSCWGYNRLPVEDDWVCDSWALDPDWRAQDAAADAPGLALSEVGVFALLPPSLREQSREDSGKFFGSSQVFDPLLLGADSLHATDAVNHLLDAGRVRIAGQGQQAQDAAADLVNRVGSQATVRTLALQGQPYTQLTVMREAYSDDEPRDDHGRWSSGGGGGSSAPTDAVQRLVSGGTVSVPVSDVPRLVSGFKDSPTAVPLQNLHVEGADHGNMFDKSATAIPRASMPQVPGDAEHMAQFTDILDRHGMTYSVQQVSPMDLHATQSELDGKSVGTIYSNYDPARAGMLVVSQDGDVLDGHHRWAAGVLNTIQNPDYKVAALVVNSPISDLLKAGYEFDDKTGVKTEGFGHLHA